MHSDLAKIIVNENEIQTRVSEMASEMTQDYRQVENVYLVGILKGAFIFLADLARQLEVTHTVDFMALSGYGKTATSSGDVRLIMDLGEPIIDKHVVIVKDTYSLI